MVSIKRLPMPLQETYEWQYDGLCRDVDPEGFFSPEAERGTPKARREEAAKALCARCPVIEQCREHALAVQEPYGVWGGLSEAERREILERRPRTHDVA
ncbi:MULTISPECIES: WhiB family transcriptional regulator [unclassified Aeromicrobium]|uniref:WhiB family transcriptional regulator n=2 Tax=Aeromicrobium TaxID=2040 RepID=UPI00288C177B|nr:MULTISPECIES: WhiB family transcriptional regulator [unclassified Aeromicrobium]